MLIGRWSLPLNLRVVGEAVAGIDPAVEAPGEGVGHPVGVAVAEDSVEHLARVGPPVAVGVAHQVDVGDVMDQSARGRRQRQEPDRDIQAIGECLDLAGPAVGLKVGEDLDSITRSRSLRAQGKDIRPCR